MRHIQVLNSGRSDNRNGGDTRHFAFRDRRDPGRETAGWG